MELNFQWEEIREVKVACLRQFITSYHAFLREAIDLKTF